jgi:hypothetical protein
MTSMMVEPLVVVWLLRTQPAEGEVPPEPVVETPVEVVDPITVERSDGQTSAPRFEQALRDAAAPRFSPPCTTEPCDPTAGAQLHVTVSEHERDYDATVTVTRADGSRVEGSVKCTICTPREAGQRVATKAIELLDGQPGEPAPGRLEVTSNPAGATVEIDGKAVGQTPMRVEVAAGSHRIVLRKQGHVTQERQSELADGGEDLVRVELPRDRSREQRTMRIAGWSLIGVGVAGVVTGIALLATDENPVKNNCDGVHVDRFGNCEFRWNTKGAGIGLLVPGILAAGAGTALVVIGRKGQPSSARARLQIGPGRIAIAGRF